MNLEELKSAWQVYDKKIQATEALQAKLIESMIRERSFSRVSVIKRQYQAFFVLLIIELVVFAAILLGNPFDFKYKLQFLPCFFLAIGVIIAFLNLLHLYRKLNHFLSNKSVATFLTGILDMYEKNKVFEKWFGLIFLSVGLIMPVSFIPQKIERNGLSSALLDTGMMMAVTFVLYVLAFRLGAFKNRHKEKFSKDLAEWKKLKSMSADLKENNTN